MGRVRGSAYSQTPPPTVTAPQTLSHRLNFLFCGLSRLNGAEGAATQMQFVTELYRPIAHEMILAINMHDKPSLSQ
jgi:hypothetical protein